ncbi:hypothetical protein M8J77_025042 [Diaphorina citri]|nr:hypothetical protein M8J77_025042 [Diaphorina citri]
MMKTTVSDDLAMSMSLSGKSTTNSKSKFQDTNLHQLIHGKAPLYARGLQRQVVRLHHDEDHCVGRSGNEHESIWKEHNQFKVKIPRYKSTSADSWSYVFTMMKTTVSDDLAMSMSLSGKSTTNSKSKFQDTNLHQLIHGKAPLYARGLQRQVVRLHHDEDHCVGRSGNEHESIRKEHNQFKVKIPRHKSTPADSW